MCIRVGVFLVHQDELRVRIASLAEEGGTKLLNRHIRNGGKGAGLYGGTSVSKRRQFLKRHVGFGTAGRFLKRRVEFGTASRF